MSDLLPEKIWYQHRTEPHNLPSYNAPPAGLDTVEYIRSDLMDAKIESLQRENERFRESIENAAVEVFGQIDHKAPTHWLLGRIVSRAKQPAITPEMRDRIGAHRARLENPNTQLRQWTLAADQIFSDLLGEQG